MQHQRLCSKATLSELKAEAKSRGLKYSGLNKRQLCRELGYKFVGPETVEKKYANGNLKSQVKYHDGNLHGKQMEWYENGQLKDKMVYENGELISREMFYPNGNPKRKDTGTRVERWNKNGTKVFLQTPTTQKSWYDNGQLRESETESGVVKAWHENGQLSRVDGPNGTKVFDRSGNVTRNAPKDAAGNKHGTHTQSTGNVTTSTEYLHGVKHGLHKELDHGVLRKKTMYVDGKMRRQELWDKNGKWVSTAEYDGKSSKPVKFSRAAKPECTKTVAALKQEARVRQIRGFSTMKKAELCEALGYERPAKKGAAI